MEDYYTPNPEFANEPTEYLILMTASGREIARLDYPLSRPSLCPGRRLKMRQMVELALQDNAAVMVKSERGFWARCNDDKGQPSIYVVSLAPTLIRRPGRPRAVEGAVTTKLTVYLTQPYQNMARHLGNGNISAGLRIALATAHGHGAQPTPTIPDERIKALATSEPPA